MKNMESKPRLEPEKEPQPSEIITTVTDKECAENEEYDRKYKVLVVGQSGVGKTSLRKILHGKDFESERKKSFGVDAVHIEFRFRDEQYHLCVYDTAGIESNKAITYSVLEDTDCLILAYAVDDQGSFDAIFKKHLPDIMKRKDAETIKYIPILGTKGDLRREHSLDWSHDVDPSELKEQYKTKFSINECSSKTKENVNEFFWSLVKELQKHDPARHDPPSASSPTPDDVEDAPSSTLESTTPPSTPASSTPPSTATSSTRWWCSLQ